MPAPEPDELEWQTRKARIDTRLEALGWKVARFDPALASDSYRQNAITEYPTNNGPADYALAADGLILGRVEAKKLSLGPQNVLTQAERYSRGATGNGFDYAGFGVPFLTREDEVTHSCMLFQSVDHKVVLPSYSLTLPMILAALAQLAPRRIREFQEAR